VAHPLHTNGKIETTLEVDKYEERSEKMLESKCSQLMISFGLVCGLWFPPKPVGDTY
jgi:hypothetical protein